MSYVKITFNHNIRQVMKKNPPLSALIVFLLSMGILIIFSCKNSGPESSKKVQTNEHEHLEPMMRPVSYLNVKINDNFLFYRARNFSFFRGGFFAK